MPQRKRSTQAELLQLDTAIYNAAQEENPVSLRGLFYRVVSTGLIEKTELAYRAVGRRLLHLRRTGVLPYAWITDGTRWVLKPTSWSDLDAALHNIRSTYRKALWADQNAEVHIFSEKDAITGVISPVTAEFDVPLGIVRGFSSETFAQEVGLVVAASEKPVFLYQLGDHDPSGIKAWQSFEGRVRAFAPDADLTMERIAVTPEQIIDLNLLTRPTKIDGNPHAKNWDDGESVEVDAIPPTLLREMVREKIEQHIDPNTLALTRAVEAEEIKVLKSITGKV